MIDRLKHLFGEPRSGGKRRHGQDELHLAAAALMVQAALMDGTIGESEQRTILDIIERQFGLAPDEAKGLFDAGETKGREASDLWAFASVIKKRFAHEERVRLIEMLWQVAYADGSLHDYEAHLLRRIAGLIYVSDHERGAARKRVLAGLGLANRAPSAR